MTGGVHGLRQEDVPEIGSQGVVSEILNGRPPLPLFLP
jgi:antitoxin component HigA of HigAB toxin-antitoxin module